jgi:flagellar basal body rod protein FlgG
MISGLYSAATAMDSATRRHEVTADNLSKVQVPGYRRQMLTNSTFETVLKPNTSITAMSPTSKLLGTTTEPIVHDFSQGTVEPTGRRLDLAITGDGFLSVQGPNGTLYTRNGGLFVNADRQLVTIDNLPVLGTGGPIVLPTDTSSEQLTIKPDGQLLIDGADVGQLQLVSFTDNNALIPAGVTLFSAPNTVLPGDSNAEIMQGFLERGSASPVDEMVSMMAASRHFEAAQRALTTIGDALQKRIGLK